MKRVDFMINRKFKQVRKPIPKARFIITSIILFLAILLFCIDLSIRPILNRAVNYQSKLITTKIISDCTYDILADLNINYNDLITVTMLDNKEVSSIQTNINTVNNVKSKIVSSITEKLNEKGNYKYQIPLGTVLGNDYLIDRGPKIDFKISPIGFAACDIISRFTSAGINQTQHQILLKIQVNITTLIPLHNADTTITTDFVIAETVIVGKVPQYYTNVVSDDQKLKSDIIDFDRMN